MKNAFVASRKRPGGVNLGLGRLGVSIWWQGRSGMTLGKMKQQITTMINTRTHQNSLSSTSEVTILGPPKWVIYEMMLKIS